MSRGAAVGFLLLLFLVSGTPPTHAAMRVCEAMIQGAGREAPTELEARKAALADWEAKAGPKFSWPLATNKGIVCLPAAQGKVVCRASGHPCTLHQVPPGKELKRLMPASPGSGT